MKAGTASPFRWLLIVFAAGRVGDRVGHRRVLEWAAVPFVVGSLLVAMPPASRSSAWVCVRQRHSDGHRGPWTASDSRPRRPLTSRSGFGMVFPTVCGSGSDRLVGQRSSVADRAWHGPCAGSRFRFWLRTHPGPNPREREVVDSDVRRRCVGSGPTGQPRPRPSWTTPGTALWLAVLVLAVTVLVLRRGDARHRCPCAYCAAGTSCWSRWR
jgi:hypothetical protein